LVEGRIHYTKWTDAVGGDRYGSGPIASAFSFDRSEASRSAVESGEERITSSIIMALGYVPLSRRRNSAMRHAMT
jgi:hypothetical protein